MNICIDNSPYGKKGEVLFPKNDGDVGYDLLAYSHPRIVGDCYRSGLFTSIKYIEYDTNVALQPDSDEYGDYEIFSLLYPRSSISNYNLSLCNSVGIIDPGYRNTIKVRFNYLPQPENYTILEGKHILVSVDSARIYMKGDKLAQLVFGKTIHPKIHYVDKLNGSDRGLGGFGSTGE